MGSNSRVAPAAEGKDYAHDSRNQSSDNHPNRPVGGRSGEGLGDAGGK